MLILEITLNRAEMAVALDALGFSTLIGMAKDSFQMNAAEKKSAAEAGSRGLVEKNLAAQRDDGVLAIDADLLAIVKVAADANLAAVIVKDIPALGKQLIVHGAIDNAVVEHTRPTPDSHRLAVFEGQADLPMRWTAILPMGDETTPGKATCLLESFPKVVSLANAGSFVEASRLFSSGTPKSLADELLRDMHSPKYSANIAFLWREDGLIADARNLMVLAGENSTWTIAETEPGSSIVEIEKTCRELCLHNMVDLWKSVSQDGD